MAGIWDRIVPSSGDRLNSHLIKSAIYLKVRGVFSDSQLLAALNAQLVAPLSAAAQTDIVNLAAQAAAGSATAKLDYLERLDALNVAVECGALASEATYRTQAGI